jgi:AbiV family abortive infection protein
VDKSQFVEAAAACLSNGQRLLEDAEWLSVAEHPETCFALATIAQEEFAKAFLLFLVSREVIAWNSLIYRATRDHACKQLLGLVMSYVNPDLDELLRQNKEWLIEHEERKKLLAAYKNSSDANERERVWTRIQEISEKLDSLPGSVADAINILRHEKVGRWQSSRWVWAHAPAHDETAKSLGEGKLDRKKQDALYVRLGRNGEVARKPAQVQSEDAMAAMDIAKRLGSLTEGLLSGTRGDSIEYQKIESAFKTVFASLSDTD